MKTIIRCCLFVGIPISLAGLLLIAVLLTIFDCPQTGYPIAAGIPLLLGTVSAARAAGRRRRKHGIPTGIAAGMLLTGIWYFVCMLYLRCALLPVALCITLPAGVCGGIWGVNSKPLPIHRAPHHWFALRERVRLQPLLLHRPPKLTSVQSAAQDTESSASHPHH